MSRDLEEGELFEPRNITLSMILIPSAHFQGPEVDLERQHMIKK